MAPNFGRILSPGRIGPLELRNRIVLPAMDQNACTDTGLVTDRVVAHYEERARGGAGLLIVETSAVAYPVGATSRHQPSLSGDDCIPGLTRLAEAAHAHGAAIAVQICHHGKVARVDTMDDREQLVPSVPVPMHRADLQNLTPDELSRLISANGGRMAAHREAEQADINAVVGAFAAAARRVQKAGIDGVEVHAGHGYLISSFLSPLYNRRDDDYGGSPDKRARLMSEVIRAIRDACGPDFAVWVRLDGQEFGAVGITPDLAARYAQMAEEAGADAIHVSASSIDPIGPGFTDGPLPWLPGQYLALARTVKAAVNVPVIAVGRLSPDLAEKSVAGGHTCDFVAMGRQLLADPDLPNRLRDGRPDLVRTCINCFVCVAENFWDSSPICAVNTRLGHYDRVATPARYSRRVMIIGGGPAGMEAARVAARRGHTVVLVERQRLGGTAWLSAVTNPVNAELVRFLESAIKEAGVDVRLGVNADVSFAASEQPDVVVVATGARRRSLEVPGGDQAHVLSGDDLRALLSGERDRGTGRARAGVVGVARRLGLLDDPVSIRRWSRRWMPIGRRVVVVGGGLVGVELAEFLAERGREVTVLEASGYLAPEMAFPRRTRAVHELARLGVRTEREATVLKIGADAVTFLQADQEASVPADHVIYAGGVEPDTSLAESLSDAGYQVHTAGDCAEVGYIQGAIHSAAAVAERI
ncbi:MAG TPA: FAD-dependent oxidoreductase [Acidimicrobiales bacterium]|nr:FAD-dependent oxidoreductase [Acidimicrobiales bacterium]